MTQEAVLNITFAGQNGNLAEPVEYNATDEEIRQWAAEAVSNGSVAGIIANADATFRDFVVDRFPGNESEQFKIFLRPKTPFGRQLISIMAAFGK